jgi:OmpA-OmpF porin, OOP family
VEYYAHTDRVGSDGANLQLSEKRAYSVQQHLVQLGLPKSRIEVFAFGETDPRTATADGVAEPTNRRVEIFLN